MVCDIEGCLRCTCNRQDFGSGIPPALVLTASRGCIVVGAEKLGHQAPSAPFFDTVTLDVGDAGKVAAAAVDAGYNLRQLDGSRVSISSCCLSSTATVALFNTWRLVISLAPCLGPCRCSKFDTAPAPASGANSAPLHECQASTCACMHARR